MAYITIGMEVHAQISIQTKLFCACHNHAGEIPNTLVCPVCLGLPGSLPVLNKKALEAIIKTGLSFSCRIAPQSYFARKHYFYPDLPKNYQISQYEEPICSHGFITIQTSHGEKKVRLRRIHLEEDAGKLIHLPDGQAALDLNRAGAPLMEIVTEPDMESVEEALAYLQKLKLTLQYLNVCTGNMEEGHLRVEPNISVRLKEEDPPGTKVELKNINSFRFAQKAMEYEIERQLALLQEGKPVTQETRRYDEKAGITIPMRSKEEASDYRYFPEPDLLPITISENMVQELARTLPELPDQKEKRLISSYGITPYEASTLIQDPAMTSFFEATVLAGGKVKAAVNFILNELQGKMKEQGGSWASPPLQPQAVAEILAKLEKGAISSLQAKEILNALWETDKEVSQIIEEKALTLISSEEDLLKIARDIVKAHQDVVKKIKEGKKQASQFLVGQMMKKTKGQAQPQLAQKVILQAIQETTLE